MVFCICECASQKLAFGAMELEFEDQLALRVPALLRQQIPTRGEVAERGTKGGCCTGAPTGCQVERRELLTFVDCRNQTKTAVELIDNLKDRLVQLLRRWLRGHLPPQRQMGSGA